MPYIDVIARDRLMKTHQPETDGELNYCLTKTVLDYLHRKEGAKLTPSYTLYNAVIGAFECAKLEMYRRGCAPYEDKKIKENGDVY